jgi:hypothetical protein
MRIIGLLVLGLVGLYFYLVEFGENAVAEKNCDGGFFIQINEYSILTNLYGSESDGNINITYTRAPELT